MYFTVSNQPVDQSLYARDNNENKLKYQYRVAMLLNV